MTAKRKEAIVELIRQLSAALAVNAVVAAVALMAFGSEKTRALKLVCSLYVLASLVVPLSRSMPELKQLAQQAAVSAGVSVRSSAALESYARACENEIELVLAEDGFPCCEAECSMDISENGGIYISEIFLEVPVQYTDLCESIKSAVNSLTGCVPKITERNTDEQQIFK